MTMLHSPSAEEQLAHLVSANLLEFYASDELNFIRQAIIDVLKIDPRMETLDDCSIC